MKKPSERERRPITHDEKEAFRKEQEAEVKRQNAEYKRLEQATAEYASSEGGVQFFRALFEECGFHNSTLIHNPLTNEFAASTVLEAKRGVWIKVRKLIPQTVLIQIENPAPQKDVAKAMEKL